MQTLKKIKRSQKNFSVAIIIIVETLWLKINYLYQERTSPSLSQESLELGRPRTPKRWNIFQNATAALIHTSCFRKLARILNSCCRGSGMRRGVQACIHYSFTERERVQDVWYNVYDTLTEYIAISCKQFEKKQEIGRVCLFDKEQ